ncbi:MAG TPA: BatD family protein [Steroidobacteraceae bacterium]|nr:BatD family protein [Steroidobacteraceae bacterium]
MRYARAALLVLLFSASLAFAASPVVRVQVDHHGPILVGESVRLEVLVFVPNFFMSSLAFPTLDIPGAVVTLEDSAENLNETIEGVTYAGIKRTYIIVPQQEGTFTLPPAKITFRYAAVPGQSAPGSVTLPPKSFSATLPAGARTQGGAVPVARVTVRQTVEGNAAGLQVGDAITRKLEIYADRTQAMMIPPPEFTAPDGVRVYRKDPLLSDVTGDKGEFLGGRRIDAATYRFDKAGSYVLPAIEIRWFNAVANRQEVARAPQIEVTVASTPQQSPVIAPDAPPQAAAVAAHERIDWKRWLIWGGTGLVVPGLVLWLRRQYASTIRSWLLARRVARFESEPAYFARFLEACRSNEAGKAYASLGEWVRRAGTPSLSAWTMRAGEIVAGDVRDLERRLYAGGAGAARWRGATLAAAVGQARQRALAATRVVTLRGRLPQLNPVD